MSEDVTAYDIIVVGSGSGDAIVDSALAQGRRVAWIDRGPLGGTCLTVGCIPSKVLIFPADRVMEIREAAKLGVHAEVSEIDFAAIMERMRAIVSDGVEEKRQAIEAADNLDYYGELAQFVDAHTFKIGEQKIRADHIFLVSGARPLIPQIGGLDEIDYLTNETVLDLTEPPDSLLIVGGGYIAAEYAHFFEAMGTQVTIVQRNERLVPDEEPEISDLLLRKLAERMDIHTQTEVVAVQQGDSQIMVTGRDVDSGEERSWTAERIMIAAGRRSNADLLQVENAGIETDERNYIQVNDYLQTNVDHIWALGDAIGRQMFKHVANREAVVAWHNFAHDHNVPMDYSAAPHAVFSHPQIGSVGLTEAQARGKHDILVGMARYMDVAKGEAMLQEDGFAKAIIERESRRILGFHIIGPYAPILVQEVVDVMANDMDRDAIGHALHIHPALPEVVVSALYHLHEPHSH